MSEPNAPDALARDRQERDALRAELTVQQTAIADAERALASARSRFGDDDNRTVESKRKLDGAQRAAEATADRLSAARERVADGIRVRVDRDIGDDFTTLHTGLPLVLLPVRLETRFATGGRAPELWIRVYPDEIHADSHEHELTDKETAAGQAYWNTVWADADAAPIAWQVLLQTVATPRAAWVVEQLTPINLGDDPRPQAPRFPQPPRKTDSWTRAAEARLLPDRFVALGFRQGVEVARAIGRAIVEPVAVTLSPDASAAQQFDISGDGLIVDDAVRWTIDFQRAVEIGMAVQMPLAAADVQNGFDELLVVGVKGSLPPQQSAAELAQLFEEHHYGRSLAFVRQGTPTNNTERAPSGYPPEDANGARSFAIERDETRNIAGRDGERFAAALGIPSATVLHVERSEADEQSGARAMCAALWPATFGYFFEELLFSDDQDEEVDAFRDYFIEHVRARGHYPAFRVGSTPYGIVVASSLTRWASRGRLRMLQSAMPEDLRRLRDIWRESAADVPRVGKTADPDRDLLDVLEMDASAREVRVRSVMGPNASINLGAFLGLNWDAVRARQFEIASRLAQRLGRAGVASLIFSLIFGKTAPAFANGFVVPKPKPDAPEPLTETEKLPFNYIRWLRESPSIDVVREEKLPAGVAPPNTLLYLLLRHAMLREAARTADRILLDEKLITRAAMKERELVGTSFSTAAAGAPGTAALAESATVWDRMATSVPRVTGNATLATFVWQDVVVPQNRRLREFRDHLRTLEDLPTAELERLLTETLDVCSHRLDAWITSMYNDRLRAMRAAGGGASVIGAFGWVMDLRAKPSVETKQTRLPQLTDIVLRRLKVQAGAALEQQTSTGGFIHTPSMRQAATAAVLRNGFLSRRQVNAQRYGIDLSSERVRRARFMLDAVRYGQPIGAVLGYQFERGLHERHRPLELDRYVEPFRRAYPLVASKLTPTDPAEGESVEAVAARNVVDGLKLHAAWQADTITWGVDGKPNRPSAHFDAVDSELRRLDETIDAVADLLMGEAVYQLVSGNTAGASASMDSLARGVRPPDPEVVKTPRGGSAVSHRAALILGGNPIAPAGWGAIATTPRADAEPHLDGWIGLLVGNPAAVRCAVAYTDTLGGTQHVEVTLSQLGIRPIDVLHGITAAQGEEQRTAADPTGSAQAAELDSRIAAVVLARADANPAGALRIDYAATDRVNTKSFPEIAELLRAVAAVLSTARSLEPQDLLAAAQIDQLPGAVIDEAGVTARATAALTALTNARDAIVAKTLPLAAEPTPVNTDRTALVDALRRAALFGIAGAYVAVPHDDHAATPEEQAAQQARTRDLVVRAQSVAAELTRRVDSATTETAARKRLANVFGDAFRALVPFTPVESAISQALTQGPSPAPSAADIREWLRTSALTRAPLDRYHRLTMLQRAFAVAPAALTVTQVPHAPNARWVALPFPNEAARPVSGTLALALFGGNPILPAANARWAGLLLDEWTELIPNREESTALAFHYDDPGAEAPQAVLIAVPPDNAENWSLDTVIAVLRETLELAKLRAVDRDLLGVLSQILPATFLPANSKLDTVAVKFQGALQKDALIVQAP
jgi:hypothetical protein